MALPSWWHWPLSQCLTLGCDKECEILHLVQNTLLSSENIICSDFVISVFISSHGIEALVDVISCLFLFGRAPKIATNLR